MPSCFQIQRFQYDELSEPINIEDVEIYRERPGTVQVTLGGRILSLNFLFPEWQHRYYEIECPPEEQP